MSQTRFLIWHSLKRGGAYALMILGVVSSVMLVYAASDLPRLLLVKTTSLDPGWYLIDPRQPVQLQRGELVRYNFVPVKWVRDMSSEVKTRAYLKRVVGVPGDRPYWNDDVLMLCEPMKRCRALGRAAPHNGAGVPFPKASFPEVIPDDQYLLLGDHPLSVDSRYLGLIAISSVTGRARPLYTKHLDYAVIEQQTTAFYETHRISDYKDGRFTGVGATSILLGEPEKRE